MIIDVIAPKGCGIRADMRLRKLVITAENVADQEKLYKIAGLIKIAEQSILTPADEKLERTRTTGGSQ